MTEPTTPVLIRDSSDIFALMLAEAKQGNKMWFNHITQRVSVLDLAFRMAPHAAAHMTPEQLVDYAQATVQLLHDRVVVPQK